MKKPNFGGLYEEYWSWASSWGCTPICKSGVYQVLAWTPSYQTLNSRVFLNKSLLMLHYTTMSEPMIDWASSPLSFYCKKAALWNPNSVFSVWSRGTKFNLFVEVIWVIIVKWIGYVVGMCFAYQERGAFLCCSLGGEGWFQIISLIVEKPPNLTPFNQLNSWCPKQAYTVFSPLAIKVGL